MKQLTLEFIDLAFKTEIVAASAAVLDKDFVGKDITKEVINSSPSQVDSCGENGEFHTFCYVGPIFKYPVTFELGEKIKKSYPDLSINGNEIDFWFCDLI